MRWWFDVQLTIVAWVACIVASVLAGLVVLLVAPASVADSLAGYVHMAGFLGSFPAAWFVWRWLRARA